jgi:hypothetical protein
MKDAKIGNNNEAIDMKMKFRDYMWSGSSMT